ncbi:MAG: hypothetical protein ACN4GM_17250 [Gammaproteobacteria bacterium]
MAALLIRFLKICLLSQGPQDLPYSSGLLRVALLVYFATGVLGLTTLMTFEESLPVMLVDIALLMTYSGLVLKAFNKTQRFVQMVSALAGVGAIFQLVEWPLQLMIASSAAATQLSAEVSIILLVAVSWNLAVFAHIFRETFEIRLLSAFLLTVAFAIINITVHQMLFKNLGV